MKPNWTPEPARWHQPESPHPKMARSLWIALAVLLVLWGGSVALGVRLGGWVHVLLGIAAGLMILYIVFGFKYVEYLEPKEVARDRILRTREMRSEHRHPESSQPSSPTSSQKEESK